MKKPSSYLIFWEVFLGNFFGSLLGSFASILIVFFFFFGQQESKKDLSINKQPVTEKRSPTKVTDLLSLLEFNFSDTTLNKDSLTKFFGSGIHELFMDTSDVKLKTYSLGGDDDEILNKYHTKRVMFKKVNHDLLFNDNCKNIFNLRATTLDSMRFLIHLAYHPEDKSLRVIKEKL